MKRTKPPYRADHVGSFLRPAALKEARAKHEQGAVSDADLKELAAEGIAAPRPVRLKRNGPKGTGKTG